MAGAKETPRQRLIGLMYIVFMALIAMQVSGDIMTKFLAINISLETANASTAESISTKIKGMAESVKERGNSKDDMKVLDAANEVHKRTTEMVGKLEGLKGELINATGGYKESHGDHDEHGIKLPADLNGADAVAVFMVGPGETKNGKGYEFKKWLEDHYSYLQSVVKQYNLITKIEPLALNPKDDPIAKLGHGKVENIDFVKLNFEHTPMAAGLAVISSKQARMLNYEAEIMAELAKKVGEANIEFDQIKAMVKPESKVVAAGSTYRAEFFLTASSSNIQPKFESNRGVKKTEGGVGFVEFKASASTYDEEGNSKQKWAGTILLPRPGKPDSAFKFEEEFIVTKPVIQVQAAAVSALYKNCYNEIVVSVPALGAAYNPTFRSLTNARIETTKDKGKIGIIPPDRTPVKFEVINEGATIGQVDFKVKDIPLPSIEVSAGGQVLDGKNGVKGCPSTLFVKPVSESTFKEMLPKEARYGITKGEVIVGIGQRIIGKVPISGGSANLSALRGQVGSGGRIVVVVEEVQRVNSKDQREVVKLPAAQSNINIPIQ